MRLIDLSSYDFLHMGCDLARSAAAARVAGCVVVEQIWAGTRLRGTAEQQEAYHVAYAAAGGPLTKPAVGDRVELFPPGADYTGAPMLTYRIAEWHGALAWMDDGSVFRWSPVVGFLAK